MESRHSNTVAQWVISDSTGNILLPATDFVILYYTSRRDVQRIGEASKKEDPIAKEMDAEKSAGTASKLRKRERSVLPTPDTDVRTMEGGYETLSAGTG